MTVCSRIHTKHINTLCGQKVKFVNVKSDGTYNPFRALKRDISIHKIRQTNIHL